MKQKEESYIRGKLVWDEVKGKMMFVEDANGEWYQKENGDIVFSANPFVAVSHQSGNGSKFDKHESV